MYYHVAPLQDTNLVCDHEQELAQKVDQRRLYREGIRAGVSVSSERATPYSLRVEIFRPEEERQVVREQQRQRGLQSARACVSLRNPAQRPGPRLGGSRP